MSLIRFEHITFTYPGRRPVLDNVSFGLEQGSRVGLIGSTGSGKTTLLLHVMGLLKPSSGTITIFGNRMAADRDFAPVRRRIGFLFQNPDDQLFNPTVLEDVAFGPLNLGKSGPQAREIALKTLEDLGLHGFAERLTHKLSGGEKRLVALATILAMDPEVLLLDEPTTGLDPTTKARLVEFLNRRRQTCLIASHEYDFLADTTETFMALEGGRIVTDGKPMLHSHTHVHHLGRVPHKHE
jgi:cobalt/nickel transport system ATP-binding protein